MPTRDLDAEKTPKRKFCPESLGAMLEYLYNMERCLLDTTDLHFASVSKRGFVRNHSYEDVFLSRFIFMQIKLIFIWKVFARWLVLKQRHKVTRKWPIWIFSLIITSVRIESKYTENYSEPPIGSRAHDLPQYRLDALATELWRLMLSKVIY